MRQLGPALRVRLTGEQRARVGALSWRCRRSEAEVLRVLIGVALDAPHQVLEAAGLVEPAPPAAGQQGG